MAERQDARDAPSAGFTSITDIFISNDCFPGNRRYGGSYFERARTYAGDSLHGVLSSAPTRKIWARVYILGIMGKPISTSPQDFWFHTVLVSHYRLLDRD